MKRVLIALLLFVCLFLAVGEAKAQYGVGGCPAGYTVVGNGLYANSFGVRFVYDGLGNLVPLNGYYQPSLNYLFVPGVSYGFGYGYSPSTTIIREGRFFDRLDNRVFFDNRFGAREVIRERFVPRGGGREVIHGRRR